MMLTYHRLALRMSIFVQFIISASLFNEIIVRTLREGFHWLLLPPFMVIFGLIAMQMCKNDIDRIITDIAISFYHLIIFVSCFTILEFALNNRKGKVVIISDFFILLAVAGIAISTIGLIIVIIKQIVSGKQE